MYVQHYYNYHQHYHHLDHGECNGLQGIINSFTLPSFFWYASFLSHSFHLPLQTDMNLIIPSSPFAFPCLSCISSTVFLFYFLFPWLWMLLVLLFLVLHGYLVKQWRFQPGPFDIEATRFATSAPGSYCWLVRTFGILFFTFPVQIPVGGRLP